jgi:hypothetical protein
MHMVWRNVELHDLTAQLTAKDLDSVVNLSGHLTSQNPVPILGHPNKMIVAMPEDLR